MWDATRIERFSGERAAASFFAAFGKTLHLSRQRNRYIKFGLGIGTNRLNGIFGGMDARIDKRVGVFVEYAPRNMRMPNTDSVNVGIYYWLGKRWRTRISWIGGNLMFDLFFMGTIKEQ